ncbi:endolytic transglycosylase MltG [Candidatus Latescibacterota bacterium]
MTMERRQIVRTAAIAGAAAHLLTIAGFWAFALRPAGGDSEVTVEIAHGMSARDIAVLLKEEGLIRNATYFRWLAAHRGYATRFKAGTHAVSGKMSPTAIALMLTESPPAQDIKVTVYEGLNIAETASLLTGIAAIDSTAFVRLAADSSFIGKLGIDKSSLEGYLYPDTYFISDSTDAGDMIERMVAVFQAVFTDSLRRRARELGMTMHEVVTLASIIQLEAGRSDELALVSQVFHRRLELERPLEANPTIQYALGVKRRVLLEDLDIDSPFNTYRYRGLPPGPIASPGSDAIQAALYPAATEYLYFMADGNGGHIFSRTLEDHNRAVNSYREIRSQTSRQ